MATDLTTCYRHHDRSAGVSCQRCGRPICPSCMTQASVGFHCPECSRSASQKVLTTRNLKSGRPIVTMVLIGINAAFFVADLVTAHTVNLFSESAGTISSKGLLVGAALDGGHPVGVAFGEWWRIITGGFIHAGLLHIGMNMLVLWLIGAQLEPALGRARFAALYFTCLIAGAFGVLLIDPTAPTVGASGAIFGLMGAAFAAQHARGINPMKSGLGGLLILNLLITFGIPGISIGGHIGGLVGGLVVGYAIFQLDRRTTKAAPAVAICIAVSALLWVGCLWAANNWAHPIL